MTVVTIVKREKVDYEDMLQTAEDPLEYLTEQGHAPGRWIGQGSEANGLAGAVVNVQDFARKSFGFEQREITEADKANHGVSPELEKWALVKIDEWKIRRHDERVAFETERLKTAEANPKLTGKKRERELAKIGGRIAAIEIERVAILERYGDKKGLKKAVDNARAAAVRIETPILQNADPVGLATALYKTKMSALEKEAEKKGVSPDAARALKAQMEALERKAAPFLAQKREVDGFRRRATEHREHAKSLGQEAKKMAGADPDAAAAMRGRAEAAMAAATQIDQMLKETPGGFSSGFTITLSFHKSVSLALAGMKPEDAAKLMEVLERTNREVIESAGRKYGRIRTQTTVERKVVDANGVESVVKEVVIERHRIKGLNCAAFFHPDARAVVSGKDEKDKKPGDGIPDMSAHIHNECSRDAQMLDGTVGAIDRDLIGENILAIGAEGNARLAQNLIAAGFSTEFYSDEKGRKYVGIKGYTDGEIERNSKRAKSIKAKKKEYPNMSDKEAWGMTRARKTHTPAELAGLWRESLARQKIDYYDARRREGGSPLDRVPEGNGAHRDDALLIRRLREKEAYFTMTDIRREVWKAAAEGAFWGDDDAISGAEARIERIAASADLILLDGEKLAGMLGRDFRGEPVYGSRKHLEEELEMFRDFKEWSQATRFTPNNIERIIKNVEKDKTKALRAESGARDAVYEYRGDQRRTITHSTDGRRFFLISALAGVGKTTALECTVKILEEHGRDVIICSSWNKAASQAAADTKRQFGKEVFTIAKLAKLVDDGEIKIGDKTVILVDEAGLASHEEMKALHHLCKEYDCSIGLQGDENQTAAVGEGKPFRRLVESGAFEVATIDVITRQKDPEQKRATALAARGDFAEVIDIYRKAGTVRDGFATREAMLDQVAADFLACQDGLKDKICIASKNADVGALNDAVRRGLVKSGALGKAVVFTTEKKDMHVEIAAGERVMLTAKLTLEDKSIGTALKLKAKKALKRAAKETLGVKLDIDTRRKFDAVGQKSEFGTVEKVSQKGIWLKMDNAKKSVFVPAEKIPEVSYGYAATVSKLQGSTFKTAFYAHGDFVNAALAYVALSRHKNACHIYATLDDARTMASDMSRKELKIDALDIVSEADIREAADALGMPHQEAMKAFGAAKAAAARIGEGATLDRLAEEIEKSVTKSPEAGADVPKALARDAGRIERAVAAALGRETAAVAAAPAMAKAAEQESPPLEESIHDIVKHARNGLGLKPGDPLPRRAGDVGHTTDERAGRGHGKYADGRKAPQPGARGIAAALGRLQKMREGALENRGSRARVLLQKQRRDNVAGRGRHTGNGDDALRRTDPSGDGSHGARSRHGAGSGAGGNAGAVASAVLSAQRNVERARRLTDPAQRLRETLAAARDLEAAKAGEALERRVAEARRLAGEAAPENAAFSGFPLGTGVAAAAPAAATTAPAATADGHGSREASAPATAGAEVRRTPSADKPDANPAGKGVGGATVPTATDPSRNTAAGPPPPATVGGGRAASDQRTSARERGKSESGAPTPSPAATVAEASQPGRARPTPEQRRSDAAKTIFERLDQAALDMAQNRDAGEYGRLRDRIGAEASSGAVSALYKPVSKGDGARAIRSAADVFTDAALMGASDHAVAGPMAGRRAVEGDIVLRDATHAYVLVQRGFRTGVIEVPLDAVRGVRGGLRHVSLTIREDGTAERHEPPNAISKIYSPNPDALAEALKTPGAAAETDALGRTALHHAAMRGNAAQAATLLAAGADPDANACGVTPLAMAPHGRAGEAVREAFREHAEAAGRREAEERALRAAEAATREKDDRAATIRGMLDRALAERDDGYILAALEHGADPDCILGGEPLLIRAAKSGNKELAEALLYHGASPGARDAEGRTALHHAARAGRGELASLLDEAGADPNARDNSGQTPLHAAALLAKRTSDRSMYNALIAARADPNAPDNSGLTPHAVQAARSPLAPKPKQNLDFS